MYPPRCSSVVCEMLKVQTARVFTEVREWQMGPDLPPLKLVAHLFWNDVVWEPRGVLSGPELTHSEGQDASAQTVSSLPWPQVSSSGAILRNASRACISDWSSSCSRVAGCSEGLWPLPPKGETHPLVARPPQSPSLPCGNASRAAHYGDLPSKTSL